MRDNFYNPRKILFTNTEDAILIQDNFRSGSGLSSSQISTLQILTITPPGEYIYVLHRPGYSAGDMLTIMHFTQHSRAVTCN